MSNLQSSERVRSYLAFYLRFQLSKKIWIKIILGHHNYLFIINVTVKQEWLDKEYPVSALRELIELLYKKADAEVRKNILTIRICGVDEWPSLEIQQPKEAAWA